MKNLLFIFLLYFIATSCRAQVVRTKIKGKSQTKKVSFRTIKIDEEENVKPHLVLNDFFIVDENADHILARGESANIELHIENTGNGTARDVYVHVTLLSPEVGDIHFNQEVFIGNVYAGNERNVLIPIKGSYNMNTGIAHFTAEVNERFGHKIGPVDIKIGTHLYQQPDVSIREAEFSTDFDGEIRPNYPVYLKLTIENKSNKTVNNLEAEIEFDNPGCILLVDKKFIISNLEGGETFVKEIVFTTKNNYPYNIVPIRVHFHDKYYLYSEKRGIILDLDQIVASRNNSKPSVRTFSFTETFVSDIDSGVPTDTIYFAHRYALIIGNEDYTQRQPLLTHESNVIYAKNDALTFKKYAINTLGVPDKNVFLLLNATFAEMKREIERMSLILEKTGNEAELIFYYAGHGYPDETTKSPYLVPIDVSATNLNMAIKLSDVYKKFSETHAGMVTFFIDACFTGGGRESGLIATRAFTVEPNYAMLEGNMIVFTASNGIQSSMPFHDKSHGIFTYFLLKKIRETKGYITYGELSDYLTNKVSIESLRVNSKEQDPTVRVSKKIENSWKDISLK